MLVITRKDGVLMLYWAGLYREGYVYPPFVSHKFLLIKKIWQRNTMRKAHAENGNLLLLTFISQSTLGAFTPACTQADACHTEFTVWGTERLWRDFTVLFARILLRTETVLCQSCVNKIRSYSMSTLKVESKLDSINYWKLLVTSESRLSNLILLNLIVRWPSECSHYINNLWNATFGLWKIRIINGWMISFEWKTSKHHENREHVATLWFKFESFRR